VKEKEEEKPKASLASQCCSEDVVLQTLLVILEANGRRRTVRALLDSGSQVIHFVEHCKGNEL